MSFILDALRKSESARQQETGPSIARIPDAVPQRGVPTWAMATIAALGAGVVVLGGAWLSSIAERRPDAGAALVASSDSEPTGPRSAPTSEAMPGSSESRLSQGRVEPLALPPPRSNIAAATAESPSTSSLTAAAGAARTNLREAASSSPPPVQTARAPTERQALPSPEAIPPSYHAAAPSLGLPALRLELLAFDENPAQRFVFINGSRYREGDTLPAGPRVIAINRRGAVLLAQGRQLQLDQN